MMNSYIPDREVRGLWSTLFHGIKKASLHPSIIGLLYIINLFFAFVMMGPLSNTLTKATARTNFHNGFSEGFDHTLFMELMHHFGAAMTISLLLALSLIIPYLIWSIFSAGGVIGIIDNHKNLKPSEAFWLGGSKFFFRYLYVVVVELLILSIVLAILFFALRASGLNPLTMESEQPIINRVYFMGGILLFLVFLLSNFKEAIKVLIAKNDTTSVIALIPRAVKVSLSRKIIGLSLVYIIVLLIISGIFFLLKSVVGDYLIPAVIVGQLYLIIRIGYKFAKTASFYSLINSKYTAA